jgi:hypothetical protein
MVRRPRSSRRSNFCWAIASRIRCEAIAQKTIERFLDVVERGGVERGLVGKAGEIVGYALRGFLKAAAQAVEPAHAKSAVR